MRSQSQNLVTEPDFKYKSSTSSPLPIISFRLSIQKVREEHPNQITFFVQIEIRFFFVLLTKQFIILLTSVGCITWLIWILMGELTREH